MHKFIKKMTKVPILRNIVNGFIRFSASNKAESIAHHFAQFLAPQLAINEDLKKEAFKIRHDVYCAELAFEDKKASGLERDDFDQHSLHCVMKHRPTGRYAGTVRVVCSHSDKEKLPIEEFCLKSISDDQVHPDDFPRDKICEISRLAVPSEFRRRNCDKYRGAETGVINEVTYSEEELRCFPFIAVGLYLSAANMVIHEKIEHCFVMMEPALARSLRFVGIQFKQIGPVVEYHGYRAPYYITPQMLKHRLPGGFKSLMRNIDDSLDEQFAAMVQGGQVVKPRYRFDEFDFKMMLADLHMQRIMNMGLY